MQLQKSTAKCNNNNNRKEVKL